MQNGRVEGKVWNHSLRLEAMTSLTFETQNSMCWSLTLQFSFLTQYWTRDLLVLTYGWTLEFVSLDLGLNPGKKLLKKQRVCRRISSF